MKRFTAIVLIAFASIFSAGVQASSVTINFEEFAVGDGSGNVGPYDPFDPATVLVSQGYRFTGNGAPDGNPYMSSEIITGTNTGGSNAYGGHVTGLGQDGYNYRTEINMRKDDGGAFAIHDLDLFMDSNGWTGISGISASSGLSVNLTGVAIGTGAWLNLTSVSFKAEGYGFGPGYGEVEIDNLTVSAVPIPAAVWLFGSALAGLGWLRRRQTV